MTHQVELKRNINILFLSDGFNGIKQNFSGCILELFLDPSKIIDKLSDHKVNQEATS